MKCAVAIVLAIIGMTIANPVPPIGLTSLAHSPLVAPVIVTSSVINHGISIPYKPIISVPIKHVYAPIPAWNLFGWNKYWH